MERISAIIATPDNTLLRITIPKEKTASKQTILNYMHEVIDTECKNSMHKLSQLTSLSPDTLLKYGIELETLPDAHFLNLSKSRLMTYNAFNT